MKKCEALGKTPRTPQSADRAGSGTLTHSEDLSPPRGPVWGRGRRPGGRTSSHLGSHKTVITWSSEIRETPQPRRGYFPVQPLLLSCQQTDRKTCMELSRAGLLGPGAALMLPSLLREDGLGATLCPSSPVHSLFLNDVGAGGGGHCSGHRPARKSVLWKKPLLSCKPCTFTKHRSISLVLTKTLNNHWQIVHFHFLRFLVQNFLWVFCLFVYLLFLKKTYILR